MPRKLPVSHERIVQEYYRTDHDVSFHEQARRISRKLNLCWHKGKRTRVHTLRYILESYGITPEYVPWKRAEKIPPEPKIEKPKNYVKCIAYIDKSDSEILTDIASQANLNRNKLVGAMIGSLVEKYKTGDLYIKRELSAGGSIEIMDQEQKWHELGL